MVLGATVEGKWAWKGHVEYRKKLWARRRVRTRESSQTWEKQTVANRVKLRHCIKTSVPARNQILQEEAEFYKCLIVKEVSENMKGWLGEGKCGIFVIFISTWTQPQETQLISVNPFYKRIWKSLLMWQYPFCWKFEDVLNVFSGFRTLTKYTCFGPTPQTYFLTCSSTCFNGILHVR